MPALRYRLLLALLLVGFGLAVGALAEDSDEPPPIIEKPDQPADVDPADTPGVPTPEPTEAPGRRREVRIWKESPLGVKAPAGMVYVPAGYATIGTPKEVWEKLVASQPASVKEALAFEVPEHKVPVPGFFMGKFEVSNAQYYAYLKQMHAEEYVTSGAHANLDEIAAFVLHMPLQEVQDKDAPYTWLLYLSNLKLLKETFPQLVADPKQVPNADEVTYRRIRRAPLPRELTLHFYDRLPPIEWEGLAPSEAQLDLPVRSISYLDISEFAEWGGVHVPTEIEWEYAARGPEGYLFPWGDYWLPNVAKANWGGKIVDERYRPTPVPVDGNPPAFVPSWPKDQLRDYDGMSWCGVWHLIGNVWEFTSSWFTKYPGGEMEHPWMGSYVKVLRGGGFTDVDELVLRAAVRNFSGIGAKGPPRIGNRFSNVGFRIAWSGNPGQDRLDPIVYRATRGKRVDADRLDLGRWAGAATHHFAGEGAPAPANETTTDGAAPAEGVAAALGLEHHVYVTNRSYAVVLIPGTSIFPPTDEKSKVKRRKDLDKLSDGDADPIPLAVLHTDVGLKNVYVRDYEKADKEKDGGRRRRKPEAPPVKKGSIPGGTYVLAFWWNRLCLTDTSLDLQCFFTSAATPESQLRIKELDKGEVPEPTKVEVTPVADTLELAFSIPMGGKKNDEDLVVLVNLLPDATPGALSEAGTWEPGRALNVPMPTAGALPPPAVGPGAQPAGAAPAVPVVPPNGAGNANDAGDKGDPGDAKPKEGDEPPPPSGDAPEDPPARSDEE